MTGKIGQAPRTCAVRQTWEGDKVTGLGVGKTWGGGRTLEEKFPALKEKIKGIN